MKEEELRAVPPFDKLPFVSEDGSDNLLRPNESLKFDGNIAEAFDADELATFRNDPKYVPKGAIRYNEESGRFSGGYERTTSEATWQEESPRCRSAGCPRRKHGSSSGSAFLSGFLRVWPCGIFCCLVSQEEGVLPCQTRRR